MKAVSAVFRQRFDLAQIPASLRLRLIEWAVLFLCDGTAPSTDVQQALRLNRDEADLIFNHLRSMSLIEEVEVSLQDYVRGIASKVSASDREPITLQTFLKVSSQEKEDSPAPAPSIVVLLDPRPQVATKVPEPFNPSFLLRWANWAKN